LSVDGSRRKDGEIGIRVKLSARRKLAGRLDQQANKTVLENRYAPVCSREYSDHPEVVKFGEGGSPVIGAVGIEGGGVEVPRSLSDGLFVLPSIAERMEYSRFAASDPKDEPKEEKPGDIE